MKSILITGGSGLIGTSLKKTADPNQLVCAPTRDLLFYYFHKPYPTWDVIIHAAGYAQPFQFQASPIGTIRVNTGMIIDLMNNLNRGGTFLFCSSSEVYSGFSKIAGATESDIGSTTPQHDRSCYIEGKRCGEALVHAYRGLGRRAMSARIAMAYGPGYKREDTRVIPQLIEQALTKRRIVLRDNGEAVRTLCYVDDTAEILWNIVNFGTHEVYNVGGPTVASIREIATVIADQTNSELVIPTQDTGLEGAPRDVRIDFNLVRTEFGKTNYVGLEEGLCRTIEWHRGLL